MKVPLKTDVKLRLGIFALAAAVGAVACTDSPTVPTTPTSTTANVFFSSQLMAGGVTMRSFNVPKAGDLRVLFTALLPETDGVVSIAVGTFDGTTCTPTTSVVVKAGSTEAVITTSVVAGEYCISVADTGVLTKTNDFSITVVVPRL